MVGPTIALFFATIINYWVYHVVYFSKLLSYFGRRLNGWTCTAKLPIMYVIVRTIYHLAKWCLGILASQNSTSSWMSCKFWMTIDFGTSFNFKLSLWNGRIIQVFSDFLLLLKKCTWCQNKEEIDSLLGVRSGML